MTSLDIALIGVIVATLASMVSLQLVLILHLSSRIDRLGEQLSEFRISTENRLTRLEERMTRLEERFAEHAALTARDAHGRAS